MEFTEAESNLADVCNEYDQCSLKSMFSYAC